PESLPLIRSGSGDGQPSGPSVAVWRQTRYLQRDVPLLVTADEIVRRQFPGHGAIEEVLTAGRLRKLEAALIRRGTGLLLRGPDGEREMSRLVLVEDRAVLRELQLHNPRLVLTPDRDLLADDLHRHPGVVVLRLVRIGRIGLLDVGIDLVDAGEGDTPRHVLVVAEVDADKRRLAAADHVPPGRIQVHEVPQRRHLDRAMRIV